MCLCGVAEAPRPEALKYVSFAVQHLGSKMAKSAHESGMVRTLF